MARFDPAMFQKRLTASSTGMATAVATASKMSDLFTLTVPKGVGIIIPGDFPLVLKLLDTSSVELPAIAEFGFAYGTPNDVRRSVPIGVMNPYQAWRDASTNQQGNVDYQASLRVVFGGSEVFLALREDEKLFFQVYSATVAVAANCQFSIPYAELDPSALLPHLQKRREWWGR